MTPIYDQLMRRQKRRNQWASILSHKGHVWYFYMVFAVAVILINVVIWVK